MRKIFLVLIFSGVFLVPSCDTNPYKQGRVLYERNCQNCHQEDGKAVATLIPPLAGSDFLSRTEDVICIIRNGLKGDVVVNGKTYNHEMPANADLSAIQIANILNYVNNSWGNKGKYVSYTKVDETLENCQED